MIGASAAFPKRAMGRGGREPVRLRALATAAVPGPRVSLDIEVYDAGDEDFRWDRVVVRWDGEAADADGGRRLAAGQRVRVFTLTTNGAVLDDGPADPGAPCDDGDDIVWTRSALRESLADAALDDGSGAATEQTDRWLAAGGTTGGDPLDPARREGRADELDVDVPSGPGRRLVVGLVVEPPSELALECWATGPRTSWLDDLPAVFRENPIAAAFLERMLATFKVEWDRIADLIDGFERYLDPTRVPSLDALRFLAAWFGFAVPNAGPGRGLHDQRRYVAAVLPLRGRRGTPEAFVAWLAAWLELRGIDAAGGRLPRVVEGFRLRRCLRPATTGTPWAWGAGADLDKAAPLGPEALAGGARLDAGQRLGEVWLPPRDDPGGWEAAVDRTLWVFLPPLAGVEDDAEAAEEFAELLDEWVPAGLEIVQRPVRPGLALGHDSLLGLNTALGGR